MPYRLHAVLVHEGQASAGHYWAYIYDHANQRWMKYNDISITESSWEELERDSFGGMTNASAYCLMYIDDRLPHLITSMTLCVFFSLSVTFDLINLTLNNFPVTIRRISVCGVNINEA